MTTSLLPEPKIQFFDNNGAPLNGGLVYTYNPGTLIAKDSYTTNAGTVAHPNPVVLDSAGRASIWLSGYYRIILRDSAGVLIWDIDNVSSMESSSFANIQWVTQSMTFTYVAATQMTTPGIVTDTFPTGTRVQADVAAGTITGTVTSSSSGGFPVITTINVIWEAGALDIGLSAVRTGVLTVLKNAIPVMPVVAKIATYALTITDINQMFTMNHATGAAFTLPAANAVPSGSWYRLKNIGAGSMTVTGTVDDIVDQAFETYGEILIFTDSTSWYGKLIVDPYIDKSIGIINNISIIGQAVSNRLVSTVMSSTGATLTSGERATVGFRSSLLTSGIGLARNIISSLSLDIPAMASLGFANSESGRVYCYGLDNAGTVEYAIVKDASMFPDNILVSTATLAGTSNQSTTMYSAIARSNLAARLLGYLEVQYGTAAWSHNPTKSQTMGDGVKRSGDIVQKVRSELRTVATGNTAMPADNTIPQITEGAQLLTATIKPTSAINWLNFKFSGFMSAAAAAYLHTALFEGNTLNALAGFLSYCPAASQTYPILLSHQMRAAITDATTFRIRVGCHNATVWTVNGYGGGQMLGGVTVADLEITEVML